MKSAGLIGLMVILVVVIGGFWIYNATMPEAGEGELTTEPSESYDSSQFLQLKPDSVPPVVKVEEAQKEERVVNDKNQESHNLKAEEKGSRVSGVQIKESGGENVAEVSEQGVIVSMTDLGFVPTSVTVGVGTVVTFVNDGQSLHWPASDIHPMHDLLSGFDAGKGISTGGAYSYKFVKKGEWSFHDHLNPDFGGMIAVE